MNNYLTNIARRYNPNQNIVRPRSPGLFESKTLGMESYVKPEAIDRPESKNHQSTIQNQDLGEVKTKLTIPYIKKDPDNIGKTGNPDPDSQKNSPKTEKANTRDKNPRIVHKVEFTKNEINKGEPTKTVQKPSNINPGIGQIRNRTNENVSGLRTKIQNLKFLNKNRIIENKKELSSYSKKIDQRSSKESLHQTFFNLNQFDIRNLETGRSSNVKNNTTKPVVKIHIGRIEIKAVKQQVKKTNSTQEKSSQPGNSLEKFLNKRGGT